RRLDAARPDRTLQPTTPRLRGETTRLPRSTSRAPWRPRYRGTTGELHARQAEPAPTMARPPLDREDTEERRRCCTFISNLFTWNFLAFFTHNKNERIE
ncbi:hypothetical protein B566_EDAN000760, partial [Ephemera danica]